MAEAQPPVRVIRNQNGRIRVAKTKINFLRLLPQLIYTLGSSCTIYTIDIALS